MFTGIITDIGNVSQVEMRGDMRARIACHYDMAGVDLGASIACDGVCLTVVEKGTDWFEVDISAETLSKTNIGANGWAPGKRLNLERALRVGDTHAERQRRVVRQRRGEGWCGRVGEQPWLPGVRVRCGQRQQQSDDNRLHEAAFPGAFAARPSRNGSTASMKAFGWSMLTAWPAFGITAFCAPGIFAAI